MPPSLNPRPIKAFPELHSEEVHEIISRPPHWLVRWGMTLFFALLMVLVAGCWLIKYPDIIATPFMLTATDAPRKLIARSEGRLQRLLVQDGDTVKRGQILAYMESVADHEQILSLGKEIGRLSQSIRRNQWFAVNELRIQDYRQFGEIQNDFYGFARKLTELKTFLNGGFYLQKRKLLQDDLNDLKEMEKNLAEQMELQRRDFDLGQDEFNVQENLHRDKVIASLEFKREKAKLLAREMPLKNLASALIQNRSSLTGKQKEILELDNAISEHKNEFQQSLQTLESSLETWKQRHILVAPVAGRISFSAPWQEQQHLQAGQELMTVEPERSKYQGLVKIPQANFGKLADGQTVLIKLDGYPYREYGMVEGNLSRLSATPGHDSAYWGYVALPNQLKTRYGRDLPYRNGLKGTAEIVTADRRLVERLVSTLRDGGK